MAQIDDDVDLFDDVHGLISNKLSKFIILKLTLVHPTCHLGREELRLLHSFPTLLQSLLELVSYKLSFSLMQTDLSYHRMQGALLSVLPQHAKLALLFIIISVAKSSNLPVRGTGRL